MVNKRKENKDQDDVDITNEEIEITEPELEEVESKRGDVIKTLRDKFKTAEAKKREALEEMQRAKADFLNAKRRLEEERVRDRERALIGHIERILPLCDSFQVAMANKEVWESVDEKWRKGVEGIYTQLQGILNSYNVQTEDPTGQAFDPNLHEALSTVPVNDKKAHDTVISVIQTGYRLTKNDGKTELIRPARVVIGVYEEGKE